MRKLVSSLFISLDGVVEAPDRFLRADLYQDLAPLDEVIGEQDAVLLGRKQYEQWCAFWPDSKIEPFATFINNAPKFVVSRSLRTLAWANSTLVSGDLLDEIAGLKSRPGRTIGIHGSISLVQALLIAGALDELKLIVCPAVAGQGRRLLSHDGDPIQFDLRSAHATPGGLQFLSFHPRR